jgi:hypothetical protein
LKHINNKQLAVSNKQLAINSEELGVGSWELGVGSWEKINILNLDKSLLLFISK